MQTLAERFPGKNALLSVWNKEGIVEFARALVAFGYAIIASKGTTDKLIAVGVPATNIAEFVGGGPILDHRVVTLARETHAGLLARYIDADLEEMEKLGLPYIDLVCVDLYPFCDAIRKPDCTFEKAIDMIDIGGPCLIRSAAKGQRDVVCDFADREPLIDWLKAGRPEPEEHHREMAAKVYATTASYDTQITRYLSDGRYEGFIGERVSECVYGENGWQTPAGLYACKGREIDPLAIDQFRLVAGREPSFNNFADIDRLVQTITHIAATFEKNLGQVPYIAIGVKHGNACGMSISDNNSWGAVKAIQRMLDGDRRAIFGGLVMTNFAISADSAIALMHHGMPDEKNRLLDGIIAPEFSDEALEILGQRAKCRLMANEALLDIGLASLDTAPRFRHVRGGFLMQPNYTYIFDIRHFNIIKTVAATDDQERDMLLAVAINATSNSNTITLVKDRMLIGNGVGQQDRVGGCKLAIMRATDAGHIVRGAVAASDSFFPFEDGPALLVEHGISAVIGTIGSVNDDKVIEVFRQANIPFYAVPDKIGRGFYGH